MIHQGDRSEDLGLEQFGPAAVMTKGDEGVHRVEISLHLPEIRLEGPEGEEDAARYAIVGLRALEDTKFDLMIVDIFMPHMRGFESIRIFHERAPTIPLVAMSGYAFANLDSPAPDFLRMALELGATRCLRKPFTPLALLTVINECLTEAQSRFTSVIQLR